MHLTNVYQVLPSTLEEYCTLWDQAKTIHTQRSAHKLNSLELYVSTPHYVFREHACTLCHAHNSGI